MGEYSMVIMHVCWSSPWPKVGMCNVEVRGENNKINLCVMCYLHLWWLVYPTTIYYKTLNSYNTNGKEGKLYLITSLFFQYIDILIDIMKFNFKDYISGQLYRPK